MERLYVALLMVTGTPRDPDDISTTLSRLVGQVDNMQKVIAGLNRILQEVQDEQKES